MLVPPRLPDHDLFSTARPLLALVDDDLAADEPVRVMSMHTGRYLEVVPNVKHAVLDIMASEAVVAVVGRCRVTLLASGTLEPLGAVSDCMGYTDPNRGWGLNPIALGVSWLAYGSSVPVDLRSATAESEAASRPGAGNDAVATLVGMAQQTGTSLWCVVRACGRAPLTTFPSFLPSIPFSLLDCVGRLLFLCHSLIICAYVFAYL